MRTRSTSLQNFLISATIGYKDTKKQGAVKLSSRTARSDLEYCIQVLFKSPSAFEEEIRDERVRKVRRYFDLRKTKKKIDDIALEISAMVKEDVRDVFIRRGFNLREVKSPDYTVVEHKGETVGCIYDEEVYIVENYPSLNPGQWNGYADTPKSILTFTSPIKMLEEAIDFLLDSPSRMDREAREERVENVRKYFQDRGATEFAKSLHDADRRSV